MDGYSYCDRWDAKEKELCGEETATGLTCFTLENVDAVEWVSRQKEDRDLNPVCQWVRSGWRPPWNCMVGLLTVTKCLSSKFGVLCMASGVLQRAWKEQASGKEMWQLVVPKTLKEAVLGYCHGGSGSGHFGSIKTLWRLWQGFYWGHHQLDVEDFCWCDVCIAYKGPPDLLHAPLQ